MRNGKAGGFTLVELMIVVAVIGILGAIAYPTYQDSVRKSRRADAQTALLGFGAAMERRFTVRNTYLGAGVSGANTGAPDATVYVNQSPMQGTPKYYDLTISVATANSFTLRATPIATGAQAGNGFLELDHTGARRWDKNNNGSIGTGENQW